MASECQTRQTLHTEAPLKERTDDVHSAECAFGTAGKKSGIRYLQNLGLNSLCKLKSHPTNYS